MAHKTGAAYSGGHIVHGCANAMYLPKVIRFNAAEPEAAERYAQMFASGSRRKHQRRIGERTCLPHQHHEQGIGYPLTIKDYEGGIIDEKEFMEKLPQVAGCSR